MDIKTFTKVLLSVIIILQVSILATSFYMLDQYGVKGVLLSLLVGYILYLSFFVGMRKVTVEENGTKKDMSNLGDFFAMIPWILVSIILITICGAGIEIYRTKHIPVPILISVLNTSLLIFALQMATKIVK